MSSAFTWTSELAALTPPFRGEGKPIAAKPVDFAKLLAPVPTTSSHHAPNYKPRASLVTLAKTGRGSLADEADALIIVGSTGQKGPFAGQFTLLSDAEKSKVVHAGVDRWIQQYGAADAVELVSLLGAWKPYDLLTIGGTRSYALGRLRRWLAHVPDYNAALARAEQLAATLPAGLPHWRPNGGSYNLAAEVFAYLFPDHRPFFDLAARQLVERGWTTSYLLGSVTSAEELARLEGRIGFGDWDAHATVIVRSLREAAEPILAAYSKETTKSLTVAHALTAFRTREAAEALALYVEQKSAHELLAAYFAANPTLADAALRPLSSSKKKPVRDGATKLLAMALASSD